MNEEKKEEVVEQVTTNVMEQLVPDHDAPIITMKKLLEAGVHFGHHTRKWNPKMSKYIYTARNGIYIIDLQKSADKVSEAYLVLKAIVEKGGKVLFVGTKKQCQEIIVQEALRSGSFYITNRWLGGTLTNFKTIQSRIRYLKELEGKESDGSFELLTKKEAALLRKEKDKLAKNLEGIKEMRKIPNAVIVTDPMIEHNAVAEARKLRIPVFGIVDTNADPDTVDYPIPANDDAIRSVQLIVTVLADAIVEAKGGLQVVAYTKDEGEEVTMKDAIRQADKENAEKVAAIRAARKEKQERYERQMALRSQHQDKARAVFSEKEALNSKKVEEEKAVVEKEEKPVEKKTTVKKAVVKSETKKEDKE